MNEEVRFQWKSRVKRGEVVGKNAFTNSRDQAVTTVLRVRVPDGLEYLVDETMVLPMVPMGRRPDPNSKAGRRRARRDAVEAWLARGHPVEHVSKVFGTSPWHVRKMAGLPGLTRPLKQEQVTQP